MSYAPFIVTKDIDIEVIVDGARAALIANNTVRSLVKAAADDPSLSRIVAEVAKEGTPTPFVTLALVAPVFNSSYGNAVINTLLDVGAYVDGWNTDVVRALIKACLRALIVDSWTIPGMTLNAATMEMAGTGFRNTSDIIAGTMRRGRQFTLRVIATATG